MSPEKKRDGFGLSVKDIERQLEQSFDGCMSEQELRALSDTSTSRGKDKVYGIDLGTTYSSIAMLGKNGVPEIIPDNELGMDTLASAVFFTESDVVIVGDAAKEEGVESPERLHQFFKRWIGHSTDPNREHYLVDGKEHDPIELSAIVLGRIIGYAKDNGEEVRDVVITCPAYFDYAQRDATKAAGVMAGLNVMDVIDEPTAAAINYCKNRFNGEQNVLVYDLGGGTFDATLMRITQNGVKRSVELLGIDGDIFLGGYDWDNALYELLLVKYEEWYGSSADEELKALIRGKVEHLKMKLTNKEKAKMKIPFDGENVFLEVTREEFESATAGYVEQTVGCLNSVLQKANMTDDDVDVVLMVGGSTRMPMIRGMLTERFGEKAIFDDPDKSVAKGAAIVADEIRNGAKENKQCEEWTNEQLFSMLQEQVQHGTAQLVYCPLTKQFNITYSENVDEKELVDIFNELRSQKAHLLHERRQVEELWSNSIEMFGDQSRIVQLRSMLKRMEEGRKCIEKLVYYRLLPNVSKALLHESGVKKLDGELSDFLRNQRRIREIVEALKVGSGKILEDYLL